MRKGKIWFSVGSYSLRILVRTSDGITTYRKASWIGSNTTADSAKHVIVAVHQQRVVCLPCQSPKSSRKSIGPTSSGTMSAAASAFVARVTGGAGAASTWHPPFDT